MEYRPIVAAGYACRPIGSFAVIPKSSSSATPRTSSKTVSRFRGSHRSPCRKAVARARSFATASRAWARRSGQPTLLTTQDCLSVLLPEIEESRGRCGETFRAGAFRGGCQHRHRCLHDPIDDPAAQRVDGVPFLYAELQ